MYYDLAAELHKIFTQTPDLSYSLSVQELESLFREKRSLKIRITKISVYKKLKSSLNNFKGMPNYAVDYVTNSPADYDSGKCDIEYTFRTTLDYVKN